MTRPAAALPATQLRSHRWHLLLHPDRRTAKREHQIKDRRAVEGKKEAPEYPEGKMEEQGRYTESGGEGRVDDYRLDVGGGLAQDVLALGQFDVEAIQTKRAQAKATPEAPEAQEKDDAEGKEKPIPQMAHAQEKNG